MIILQQQMMRSRLTKGISFYSHLLVRMKVGWKVMLKEVGNKDCFL